VLADRVGIIDVGRLVAEGTPTDLKRSIGTDVIVARLDRDASTVCASIQQVPGVLSVEARGTELIVSVTDGSTSVSPVAVALNACDVAVRDLTLRTPTLDDVFLELTGNRIQHDDSEGIGS
jgi:ABC-2 type transport system ATP-binding protein